MLHDYLWSWNSGHMHGIIWVHGQTTGGAKALSEIVSMSAGTVVELGSYYL